MSSLALQSPNLIYIPSPLTHYPDARVLLGISPLIPLNHINLLCPCPRLASRLQPLARICSPTRLPEMRPETLPLLEHPEASMALISTPAPSCTAFLPSDLTANKSSRVSENSPDM